MCCSLQLLAEKWILSPAWWGALWRVQAAQLHQPASERGLLNFSFLGTWCWRRREQSLTPRRWNGFGTQGGLLCQMEGCLVSSSTPSTCRDEERGSQEVNVTLPSGLLGSRTYICVCTNAARSYKALIAPCSQWYVLGTCTPHPTVLSLCEGCSIKQKLDVSCGLKCVLKISFWVFNSLALFLVFCQSQTNSCFPVASAPVLVPTDPTEKEVNFSFSSRGCNQLHPDEYRMTEVLPTCPWGVVDVHNREWSPG